jgi:hypothetical protein
MTRAGGGWPRPDLEGPGGVVVPGTGCPGGAAPMSPLILASWQRGRGGEDSAGWPAEAHIVCVVVPLGIGLGPRNVCARVSGPARVGESVWEWSPRRSMWWMAWHGGSDCAGTWARSLYFPRGAVVRTPSQWWCSEVAVVGRDGSLLTAGDSAWARPGPLAWWLDGALVGGVVSRGNLPRRGDQGVWPWAWGRLPSGRASPSEGGGALGP